MKEHLERYLAPGVGALLDSLGPSELEEIRIIRNEVAKNNREKLPQVRGIPLDGEGIDALARATWAIRAYKRGCRASEFAGML